jgi:hypothetical protein
MKSKNRLMLIGAFLLAAMLALALWGVRVLSVLRLYDAEGRQIAVLVLADARFSHRFTHSIHKTPVDEEYRIEGNRLELYAVRYDTYGVGMPSDEGGNFRIENGRFVIDLRRSFDRIDIRVSHLPGHGISIGGSFFPFTAYAAAEDLITLKAGTSIQFSLRR